MRKYVIVLFVVFLVVVSPRVTFAADALVRMMHADEVEQFKQDQDAMIVGQLIDIQGDKFKVKVLKLLNGKVSSDSILVSDDFSYGWNNATPSVNDFAVFSLKKSGEVYKKAWGVFKANSGDYRNLELQSIDASKPGSFGDLAAIQWYVNTGGTEKDFSFYKNTVFVSRPNGQVLKIYPVPASGMDAKAYFNGLNQIQNNLPINDDTRSDSPSYIYTLSISVVVLIGIGTVLFVRFRKGKVK